MTCQIFLSEKAQRDLDTFSDKIANQILADCARLAHDAIPDGKRIKKLHGFKRVQRDVVPLEGRRLPSGAQTIRHSHRHRASPEQAGLSEGVLSDKKDGGAARCLPCSRNAHDQNVLVRRAQSKATLATPLKRDLEKQLRGPVVFYREGHPPVFSQKKLF